MPSSEKQVHTQAFTNGIDTVTAPEFLGADTARYFLNCYTLSTGVGNVGVVTNIKGNTIVSDTLPSGLNKCIGKCSNEENNRFFFFIYNSNGYHSIRMYDEISNTIIKIVESITDTGGVDVLNFKEDWLILMADVVRDDLLYWVDGLNDARKINIKKALDPTISGYGGLVSEEFINAYKLAPNFAPTLQYFSDTSKNFNYLYGRIRKFAYRFRYDDGELSTYGQFSSAATPPYENFNGVNSIPTDNNGINITVETGSILVKQIEIIMWEPTAEVPNPNWVTIAVIDKDKKGINSNNQYVYKFYNDGSYPATIATEVQLPYSFLPKSPLCQAVAGGSIIYSNFNEGFADVPLDVAVELTYEELFIDDGVENEFNDADITIAPIAGQADYIESRPNKIERWTKLDGTQEFRMGITRASAFTVQIGNDVKKGNKFVINLFSGNRNATAIYEATLADDATTVAYQLKQQLINHGVIILAPADNTLTPYNIYDNSFDSFGNLTFRFWAIVMGDTGGYFNGTASVNDVQFDSLKDTGQSVSNMKLGAGTKYGLVYYDFQGRYSLVYTDDILNTTTATENTLGGIKSPVVTLTIKHQPPVWARYYEVVRTRDLTFGTFIDMLIQKVIEVNATTMDGEYLDLVVGSLYTYQRIHPNTTLKYEFKKGDRIRLKKKLNGTYYPDFETEILSYQDVTTEDIESNVVINGTTTITVSSNNESNIGRYVQIDGYERQIVGIPIGSTTQYLLNAQIGDATSPRTVLGYKLIDRRGLLRIRKPNASLGVNIEDNSLVEIFTPSVSGDEFGARQFYHFGKKFDILNAGLPNRYHAANQQNQSAVDDAEVRINEGTVYVRNRALPLTNNIPNAQVVIMVIEDESYSDFYYSKVNANGRTNVEDNKRGVVHFGDRMRFSNIQIEDTTILGFNMFENLNRKDYNDKYGDIMLTIASENQIFVFKMFKDCIVPVFQNVIQDASGQEVLGVSKTLLNDIRYYSHDGGIGNNPESYARNENNHYHVSPNSGCWIRLGGDGATPISEIYFFDNEARDIIMNASKNGAKIFGDFDPMLSQVIWHVEGYVTKTLSTGFNTGTFETLSPIIPNDTLQTITVPPTNGTLSPIVGGLLTYTPNAGYVGSDSFEYESIVDGNTITRKVCISVNAISVQQLAWRAKQSSGSCVVEDGVTTGYLAYSTLEQYNIFDGVATGVEKLNTEGQPDYVTPIYSSTTCIPAKWVIDDAYSYCEQSTGDVLYIWGRIETENVEEVESGIFVADLYLKVYKGLSSTTPPDFIDDNLYPITIGSVLSHMTGDVSPTNFSLSLSNESNLQLTEINTSIPTYGATDKYFITNIFTSESRAYNVRFPNVIIGVEDGVTGANIKLLTIVTSDDDNTGFLIQPKEKKVTNDVNEFPMDVNNELCSVSGLPQALRNNSVDSPTYRIVNTDVCPIDPSSEVNLTVFGTYSSLEQRFQFDAGITSALDNELTVNFNVSYKENGFEFSGVSDTVLFEIGETDVTKIQEYPISGDVTDIVVTITVVTPNPNGTKTIIY